MKHKVNATATPLDAYRHARIITVRQFDAGNWLRDNWIKAGREPHLTQALDEHGRHDSEEAGGPRDRAQTKARRKVRGRLGRLDPTSASCVWNVCCMAEGAERWAARIGKPAQLGLVVLKEALDGMAGKGDG